MKSKYQKAIVYDLETGGFSPTYNQITEAAFVVVDLNSLEIIEQHQITFLPRMDLSWIKEPIKDAKTLYKSLGKKDSNTGVKTLEFGEHSITLKNIDPLVDALDEFYRFVNARKSKVFNLSDIRNLEKGVYSDVVKLFFDYTYNPQALEVTHITRDMLEEEGVDYEEAYKKIKELFTNNTVGNSRPIAVGHNIGSLPRRIIKGKEKDPDGFDNPFMEKFFNDFKDCWFSTINDDIIDTLKWARKKWPELANYTLGTCANEVGQTLKEAHRALPDTVANAKFFIKMMSHLRGEGSLKSQYKRRKFNVQI